MKNKMQIDFFEEFPATRNLSKLKLISWPCLIYIASPSLKEFRQIEKQAKAINPKLKYGYWPILKKTEGYWLSPWSKQKALIRIINELKKNKKPLVLLWDWELPLLTPHLFITQLKNKKKNRQIIYDFFKKSKQHKIKLALVELSSKLNNKFGNRRIIMSYSSNFQITAAKILKRKIKLGKKFKNRVEMGLGCIAPGILKIEPKLFPKQLDRDLNIVKNSGIKKVVIFRLGGLDKEYVGVIKKYL